MNAIRSTAAALAVGVVWSSTVLAGPPAEAQKTTVPSTRPLSREQVQSRLKAMRIEETQRIASLLKPAMVVKEVDPASVDLQGCHKSWVNGNATHDYTGSFLAPGCSDHSGIDTVKFGIILKNNWTIHSVVLDKVCSGGAKPCGEDGDATLVPGGFESGKSALPDLLVKWQKSVAYSPVVRVVGPVGTQPY